MKLDWFLQSDCIYQLSFSTEHNTFVYLSIPVLGKDKRWCFFFFPQRIDFKNLYLIFPLGEGGFLSAQQAIFLWSSNKEPDR